MSKYGSKLKFIGKGFSVLIMLSMILSFVSPAVASAAAPQAPTAQAESVSVEQLVREEIASEGVTDFFVWMKEKADLSPAYALQTKEEKGQFVFDTLTATAERTQKELRAYLDAQGIEYSAYYISNKILVHGGNLTLVDNLATRQDVARITANHQFQLDEPVKQEGSASPEAIESNLSYIFVPDVWALGYDGASIVLAGNDTGLDETHSAIARHYRGCIDPPACTAWDHNYNWWDATDTYATNPNDGHGHGTHTTGTMVGDDGGTNQIGVAPGAQTIHCKNMTDGGSGSDATFSECFQWDLAPWDLTGANPIPALAPDAINNSWGYGGGNQPQFEDEIAALHAAGILVEVSAGNEGPGCSSLRSPGDYVSVLTTGSVSHEAGAFPGPITGSSSRGPSDLYAGDYFPDIMAPGNSIRSSLPGNTWGTWGGTSMAGPHATALVGLMWDAAPALRGNIDATIDIIRQTAEPLTGQMGSNCGGDYVTGPNNDWGTGTINALAAVQAAMAFAGGDLFGTVIETGTGAFIEGALVEVTDGENIYDTTTSENGTYNINLPVGTFDVTFSAFGYEPFVEEDVVIIEDQTTELNVTLDPAEMYTVSGAVADDMTGMPVYAEISIPGYPGGSIWNDPVTGAYSVELPGGSNYTLSVESWAGGYLTASDSTGILDSDIVLDFYLEVDLDTCSAPGYEPEFDWYENFEAGNGGFTVSGTTSWDYGIPTNGPGEAHSGNNVWATNLSGDYGTSENGYITSPSIDLSAYAGQGILVSWWQWLRSETGYDFASVEVSKDGGSTWIAVYGPISGPVHESWTNLTATLDSTYAVANFQIRFHFTSDGSVYYPGWYIDDVGILAIPEVLPFIIEDFEGDNGGYSVSGATTSWEYGTPSSGPGSAFSGTGAWATNLEGDYGASEDGYITSPVYNLSSHSGEDFVLSWYQYLNTESGYDFASVEVSGDGGSNWTVVYGEVSGSINLSWSKIQMPVPGSFATANFMVRFHFRSDSSVYRPGWYVDDLAVTFGGGGAEVPCLPLEGGLVVGTVYDINNGTPLVGAVVTADTGAVATTVTTPDDDWLDDGFYMIFVEGEGAHELIASEDGYGDESVSNYIFDDTVMWQDFMLEAAQLVVDPTSLDATLDMGETEIEVLTLTNAGGADVTFEITERDNGFIPAALSVPAYTGKPVVDTAPQSMGRAPNAPEVSQAEVSAWLNGILAGEPAFAVNLMDDTLVNIPDTTAPGTWNVVGPTMTSLFAGDFLNGDFTTLYAVSYDDNNLYTIDVASGTATLVGPTTPGTGASFGGLTGAPDGTLFGLATVCNTSSTLMTIDPDSGATTVVGVLSGVTCGIDLAYSTADNMIYVVDLITDSLFRVDPDTAATTLVGSLGVAANYAQGMDYEEETGILYWAAYTSAGELRVIDMATGASTLVGSFPGGAEVDSLAFTTGGSSGVLWLDEDPITGTISAFGSVDIEVTFDASIVAEPGEYLADLRIANDSPYGPVTVPVTMTVLADASLGILDGIVGTSGYCGENPALLEGALVTITDTNNNTWTRTTAADGTYSIYLDPAGNPYTVAVTADGYGSITQTGINIVASQSFTASFELVLLAPCVSVTPAAIDVDVPSGSSTTAQLTLDNDGFAAANFSITEMPESKQPLEDIILDGSFEDGTPSTNWNEYSLNYGTPLCDETGCGTGGGTAGSHTGLWWAWFGGYSGYEEGSVDQDVVIPSGQASLSFYLWYGNYGGDTDYLAVEIDGTEIWRVTGAEADDYAAYTLVTLDVSDYADGSSHNVAFHSENFSSEGSNINVDDVVLDVTANTDVPWLSVDPTEGTVAANSSFNVEVTFTALPTMTIGSTYEASLRVSTGDPENPTVLVPVSITIDGEATFGVEVSPDQALSGDPGETLSFDVVITNTGDVEDVYTITLGAHDYEVDLLTSEFTLGAGEVGSFTVTVYLPEGGTPPSDVIPVIVTSTGDDTVTATTNLTASIIGGGYMLFLPIVNREFQP